MMRVPSTKSPLSAPSIAVGLVRGEAPDFGSLVWLIWIGLLKQMVNFLSRQLAIHHLPRYQNLPFFSFSVVALRAWYLLLVGEKIVSLGLRF